MFQPNRKSKNGSRHLSRVPRGHSLPAWSTVPPIAREVSVDKPVEDDVRRILRGMILVVTDVSVQEKVSGMLDGLADDRLVAMAQEALSNFKRAKGAYDSVASDLQRMKQEITRFRDDNKEAERALVEVQRAVKERDDIAQKYKELQKQLDPEKHQLEIMYAIDEATTALKEEATGLRRELGQRQTEVNDLRASKKRLREAMDRLARKD